MGGVRRGEGDGRGRGGGGEGEGGGGEEDGMTGITCMLLTSGRRRHGKHKKHFASNSREAGTARGRGLIRQGHNQ